MKSSSHRINLISASSVLIIALSTSLVLFNSELTKTATLQQQALVQEARELEDFYTSLAQYRIWALDLSVGTQRDSLLELQKCEEKLQSVIELTSGKFDVALTGRVQTFIATSKRATEAFINGNRVQGLSLFSKARGEATAIEQSVLGILASKQEDLSQKSQQINTQAQLFEKRILMGMLLAIVLALVMSRLTVMSFRRLQQSLAQINELNSNLELKIQERTIELEQKNKMLQSKIEENKNLIRILCHDLINPVSIVIANARKAELASREQGGDLPKYYEKILKAVMTEKEIIDYVREFEALSAGKEIELVAVDLEEMFEKAQFIFQNRLQEKDLKLVYEQTSTQKLYVKAEPLTLSNNVLNNLISNAIKFSHRGQTIVMRASSQNGTTLVTIADSGMGIPSSIVENLFSMNARISRIGTEGEKGTGFGMPLVHAFMQKYGGTITVESIEESAGTPQHGTTVKLTFASA